MAIVVINKGLMYKYTIQTPSPYDEEQTFVIPNSQLSSELIDWKPFTSSEFSVVIHKAFDFVVNKHIKKGGKSSLYELSFYIPNNQLKVINSAERNVPIEKASKYWVNLMKDPKTKIIFIPLTIRDENVGHANVIIIDKRRKCVEFFDPHGRTGCMVRKGGENLVSIFEEQFVCGLYINKTCFIPETYEIRNYRTTCPVGSFQDFENTHGIYNPFSTIEGYCAFWTIFLLDLRLSNLTRETYNIQSDYIKQSLEKHDWDYDDAGDAFRKFIVEYSNYWGKMFTRSRSKRKHNQI